MPVRGEVFFFRASHDDMMPESFARELFDARYGQARPFSPSPGLT